MADERLIHGHSSDWWRDRCNKTADKLVAKVVAGAGMAATISGRGPKAQIFGGAVNEILAKVAMILLGGIIGRSEDPAATSEKLAGITSKMILHNLRKRGIIPALNEETGEIDGHQSH